MTRIHSTFDTISCSFLPEDVAFTEPVFAESAFAERSDGGFNGMIGRFHSAGLLLAGAALLESGHSPEEANELLAADVLWDAKAYPSSELNEACKSSFDTVLSAGVGACALAQAMESFVTHTSPTVIVKDSSPADIVNYQHCYVRELLPRERRQVGNLLSRPQTELSRIALAVSSASRHSTGEERFYDPHVSVEMGEAKHLTIKAAAVRVGSGTKQAGVQLTTTVANTTYIGGFPEIHVPHSDVPTNMQRMAYILMMQNARFAAKT